MYIVITGSGSNQHIAPRKLSDANWDETVLDIARGEWTDISSVIQASTGFDVLSSMASQVMTIWADREEPLTSWQRDFIEQNVSIQAANKFAMEPA